MANVVAGSDSSSSRRALPASPPSPSRPAAWSPEEREDTSANARRGPTRSTLPSELERERRTRHQRHPQQRQAPRPFGDSGRKQATTITAATTTTTTPTTNTNLSGSNDVVPNPKNSHPDRRLRQQHQHHQQQRQQQQQQGRPRRIFRIQPPIPAFLRNFITMPGGGAFGRSSTRAPSSSSAGGRGWFLPQSFVVTQTRVLDAVMDGVSWFVEKLVYLLGPVLICLALGIVSLLTYSFATVLGPMTLHKYSTHTYSTGDFVDIGKPVIQSAVVTSQAYAVVGAHAAWVFFLVFNILYNYWYCVMIHHSGPKSDYTAVVQELAEATQFRLPETPHEIQCWRREYEDKMVLRVRRRQAREQERYVQHQQHVHQMQQQQQQQQLMQQQNEQGDAGDSSSAVTHRRGGGGGESKEPSATAATCSEASATAAGPAGAPSNGGAAVPAPPTPPTARVPTLQRASPQSFRRWMLMGPYEWGYCHNSDQPKPPRSHYDHVTKQLVLNLDHYCPWTFNPIGYFNYRYFVNFLIYVFVGMMYGAMMTFEPFMNLSTGEYQKQWSIHQQVVMKHGKQYAMEHLQRIQPMLPFRHERMLLTLSFMLCTAVGLAVMMLCGFHIYLTMTAQTTIEFHGNMANKRRARQQSGGGSAARKWKNPYCRGSWRKNWQQVFGPYQSSILFTILPSSRKPAYLPVPVPGHSGLRKHLQITNNRAANTTTVGPGHDDKNGNQDENQRNPLMGDVEMQDGTN